MMDPTFTKAVLFGVGGAIVGGIHSAWGFIMDKSTDILLCTPYTELQHDSLLLRVLSDINADFTEIDPVAAVRTIQAIDRLVGIRRSLDRREQEPIMSDRVTGFMLFQKAKESIQRFISRAEVTNTPRRVIYLQRQVQTIMQQIDAHVQAIVMATRDMHMHP